MKSFTSYDVIFSSNDNSIQWSKENHVERWFCCWNRKVQKLKATKIWSPSRKTWDIWTTWRARPLCIFARCINFIFNSRGYVNPFHYNVGACCGIITIQLDYFLTTWGSPDIAVSNITHFHCMCTIIRVILLVNNHRVFSSVKFNILKSDLAGTSGSSLI